MLTTEVFLFSIYIISFYHFIILSFFHLTLNLPAVGKFVIKPLIHIKIYGNKMADTSTQNK